MYTIGIEKWVAGHKQWKPEYIVVGDHNNDDESYMAYATSYS